MASFSIKPINASFGAEVRDINLARVDDVTFTALYAAWLEYALLIFPGQHLSNKDQVVFARRFGELEFDLTPISNVRKNGSVRLDDDTDEVVNVLKGNMGWHADSTYMPVQAKGAVFTAHVVPESKGETGWADMRSAYDVLSTEMKDKVSKLSAHHSLIHSQTKIGLKPKKKSDYSGYGLQEKNPPLRPLVKVHPETGRASLLIGRHAYGIPGLTPDESETLLQELVDNACQAPRIYHHHWQPGDAVVWDNRCLLHRACPWNMQEPRVMYHARIAGSVESEFADIN